MTYEVKHHFMRKIVARISEGTRRKEIYLLDVEELTFLQNMFA